MSTALVPVLAVAADSSVSSAPSRPRADFIAQLIAAAVQAPQTRVRRRAEPEEASAVYGKGDQVLPATGARLSRSL
jgi:hypothetical protein